MSKIYTKTGDRGQTSLMDGTRVSKSHIRVEAYGTVDELNSVIGVVLAEMQRAHPKGTSFVEAAKFKTQKYMSKIKTELITIQRDLFEIGSLLANPAPNLQSSTLDYFEERIQDFEKAIDIMTELLPPLTNFILPGGGKTGTQLHIARSITRRVERRIIELSQGEEVEGAIVKYFNRLSDLFFTMSRFVNFKEKKKEILWEKRK